MFAAAILLAAASSDPVVGTWEGTSLCQVKPSPCRDEHAIYRFKLTQPRQYEADGYKLVAGGESFMGSIKLTLDVAGTQLDGPIVSGGQSHGRLHLTLKGRHLSGTLMQADGTLYRLIELDKH